MIHGHDLVHIGWSEQIDIPDWGITGLKAKSDTGARSSSLHVENIVELPRRRVSFEVILHRTKRDRRVQVIAPIARLGRVKSSNGISSHRVFVNVRIAIGPVEREIELNLVDRGEMIHRMLLGRTALHGMAVLVDRAHVLSKAPKRKRRPTMKGTGA